MNSVLNIIKNLFSKKEKFSSDEQRIIFSTVKNMTISRMRTSDVSVNGKIFKITYEDLPDKHEERKLKIKNILDD